MNSITPRKQKEGLCVLITNSFIANLTGSELYVRDVAVELLKRGHKPVVYSPRLGDLANEIRASNIQVVNDLKSMSCAPDLIHGQHHLETMTALSYFTDVPAIYFCHGWVPWEETPPVHPRIIQYVAVSDVVRDYLVNEQSIPEQKTFTLLNFVDLERFKLRPPLSPILHRALIYSNQVSENNYVGLVREACARQGISLDVVGLKNGNPTDKPEALLGQYDIIFARGRAALEGLVVGAAVVCCDAEGLGPMVTTENLERLRRMNFGVRVLNRPLSLDLISEEIRRYDPIDAIEISRKIRSTSGLSDALNTIIEIYRTTLATWSVTEPRDGAAESRDISNYLKWISQSNPHQIAKDLRKKCNTLREKNRRLKAQLDLLRSKTNRQSGRSRSETVRSTPCPRILALLQIHNEMRFLPDYFRNVAPHVDGIIALDDGSNDGSGEFVDQQASVLQLIRLPPRSPHAWDEPHNRRLLIEAAWKHNPEWLIVVDSDERLEWDFRRRAHAAIARAEREGYLAYRVKLLELWDIPDMYRADGVWGQKRPVRFFKARPDHQFDNRIIHGLWAPLNSGQNGHYPVANLIIYHLRMINPSDRLARQERYKRLDPDNQSQKIGYDYLTDTNGLVLKKLPRNREYEPLQVPRIL